MVGIGTSILAKRRTVGFGVIRELVNDHKARVAADGGDNVDQNSVVNFLRSVLPTPIELMFCAHNTRVTDDGGGDIDRNSVIEFLTQIDES